MSAGIDCRTLDPQWRKAASPSTVFRETRSTIVTRDFRLDRTENGRFVLAQDLL
jgi:hypothetical protein